MQDSISVKKKQSIFSHKAVPYLFIAPFVIFFLVVYLYPFFKTIMMSFQRIDGPNHITWIGWSNYQKLFKDRNFSQSLMTTLRYAVWDLAILCTVPLIVAVILNSGYVKVPAFFKSVFFIPALTSTIVAGIVFRLAFGTLDTSIANRVMALFGQKSQDWLMHPGSANFVLIILTLWRWMGVNVVYYISGLQAIPPELYEAAEIDGASSIQKFFYVTLPGVRPVLIYVITITVLGGFAMFTESVALFTQKYAGGIGRTIVGYMYQVGFYKSNLGMASAVGIVLLIIVFTVNFIQLILMGFFRKEN